jgi:hypothetical protein
LISTDNHCEGRQPMAATSTPVAEASSGRCVRTTMPRPWRWKPCPTTCTYEVRPATARSQPSRAVIAAPTLGIRPLSVPAAGGVDQLIRHRDCGRLNLGGREASCPEPAQRLSPTISFPWSKPGVLRATSDERPSRRADA